VSLEDEDTWVERFDLQPQGPLGRRRSTQAASPRTAALRRDNSLRLLTELLDLSMGERQRRLQERRFHDLSLLDLLLEMGHAALSEDVQRAVTLTTLAVDLGSQLQRHGDLENQEVLSRAVCLAGTSRRLVGDLAIADATFERAGRFAVSASERGFYCRSLALLRWDQGRTEEAIALLHQAGQRFAETLEAREQAVSRALLGLLHVEEGQLMRATSLLVRASLELPSETRPWLAAQTWLALALCYAYRGNRGKARSARQRAWSLYGEVKDEFAQLSLGWLEGKGAHLIGDPGAEELLQAVRYKLIDRRLLPETTLITIDLGFVLLLSGRWSDLGGLVDEIALSFAGNPGLDLALGALSPYVADAAVGRLDAAIWSGIAPVLRLAFRLEGIPLQPVPFA
jgi:tetratricopeptide (TPR) repeat protein